MIEVIVTNEVRNGKRGAAGKRGDERYEAAAAVLPSRLRQLVLSLPLERQGEAEEIRLRAGQPLTVLLPEGERRPERVRVEDSRKADGANGRKEEGQRADSRKADGEKPALPGVPQSCTGGGVSGTTPRKPSPLDDGPVEPEELETLCDLASEFSRYAAAETIRDGFLPVRGGVRVGLCGTAVLRGGVPTNLTRLSSASVRIAREHRDAGRETAPLLFRDGQFQSTLLLSPPGGGKTTLLRDLVRRLSEGVDGIGPRRVALIDERGEAAAMFQGRPQLDVGPRTDVLDGCPKAVGIPMVLRAMNPQIIAVDEITAREDIQAVMMAAGCGAGLLATVHGAAVSDLWEKPLYRELMEAKVFRLAVRIVRAADGRRYEVEELCGN